MVPTLIEPAPAPLPVPRASVSIRPAVMGDLPFIDALQRRHTKQVGFMPTAQFEGKIRLGHALVADGDDGRPAGYLIGNDRYFKRDDVGAIFQVNVVPEHRRSLVAAALVAAQFARSAYGCRLYCCWCAQDLDANRFWEAMGFVPLAYRAGSRGKRRVHLFWQRRITAGDEATPWWFPFQTGGGAIREDRVVLPIPPGTRWGDPMPTVVLPGTESGAADEARRALPGRRAKRSKVAPPPSVPATIRSGGLRFAPASEGIAPIVEAAKREPKPAAKHNPRMLGAARELRDRYLEKLNDEPWLLPCAGKYDVGRAQPGRAGADGDGPRALPIATPRLLPAAA